MIEARPTEYSGVVFRSKCEAIFATALDEMGLTWEYEPEEWKREANGTWVPDFKVAWPHGGHKFSIRAIEYKPSEPTDQYMRELAERFCNIQSDIEAALIYSNPYEPCRSGTECLIPSARAWVKIPFESGMDIYNLMHRNKNYRFDLKNPS